jgi:hypothetical protein
VCVLYRGVSTDQLDIAATGPAPASASAPCPPMEMMECVGSARIHAAGPSYAETRRAVPLGIKDI